jgi:hypothetical protein
VRTERLHAHAVVFAYSLTSVGEWAIFKLLLRFF